MNKSGKIKILVGFLTLVILSTSIYIMLPDSIRIDVGKLILLLKYGKIILGLLLEKNILNFLMELN